MPQKLVVAGTLRCAEASVLLYSLIETARANICESHRATSATSSPTCPAPARSPNRRPCSPGTSIGRRSCSRGWRDQANYTFEELLVGGTVGARSGGGHPVGAWKLHLETISASSLSDFLEWRITKCYSYLFLCFRSVLNPNHKKTKIQLVMVLFRLKTDSLLGVSFAMVNRGENGKTVSSKLAQATLENFCTRMAKQGKLKNDQD